MGEEEKKEYEQEKELVQTSMDGEVLYGDGGGQSPDVVQTVLSQASGGAAHGLGLTVQGKET